MNEKYDVGKIYNKRRIELDNNTNATDICFLYLNNLDFLKQSINKKDGIDYIEYKEYEKINLVPSFTKLLKLTVKYFYRKFNH